MERLNLMAIGFLVVSLHGIAYAGRTMAEQRLAQMRYENAVRPMYAQRAEDERQRVLEAMQREAVENAARAAHDVIRQDLLRQHEAIARTARLVFERRLTSPS